MSYILEALRKAERERNLGQVPTLEGLPPEMRASRRRMWPWMLGIALLANAAAVALFVFFPRKAETPAAATPAPATASVEEIAPAPNVEVRAPFPDIPPEPQVVDIPPQQVEVPPVAEARQAPEPVPEPRAAETPPAVKDIARPAEPEVPPPADVAPEPPAQEPESVASASSSSGVKELRDMPSAFRHDLPPMKLDAHFYSEDASRRFVMINLHKYREGERLSEGPQVDSIEADGVILSYQGQRFLLPLPR
jgi:general secretion pathway protein B